MLVPPLRSLVPQWASMKVPPKRKGNTSVTIGPGLAIFSLNESPSEKEGKSAGAAAVKAGASCLNESPSKKEGKLCTSALEVLYTSPQ